MKDEIKVNSDTTESIKVSTKKPKSYRKLILSITILTFALAAIAAIIYGISAAKGVF